MFRIFFEKSEFIRTEFFMSLPPLLKEEEKEEDLMAQFPVLKEDLKQEARFICLFVFKANNAKTIFIYLFIIIISQGKTPLQKPFSPALLYADAFFSSAPQKENCFFKIIALLYSEKYFGTQPPKFCLFR